MSNLIYRSLWGVLFLCTLNFIVFLAVANAIGGDAMNGQIMDGHFYLRAHAKLTEVSETVFIYSLWHVRSLFVTLPLTMLISIIVVQESKSRETSLLVSRTN